MYSCMLYVTEVHFLRKPEPDPSYSGTNGGYSETTAIEGKRPHYRTGLHSKYHKDWWTLDEGMVRGQWMGTY